MYLNLRVARGLYDAGVRWALASLAGISVASVWNYSVSAMLVWRINRRARFRGFRVVHDSTSAGRAKKGPGQERPGAIKSQKASG